MTREEEWLLDSLTSPVPFSIIGFLKFSEERVWCGKRRISWLTKLVNDTRVGNVAQNLL